MGGAGGGWDNPPPMVPLWSPALTSLLCPPTSETWAWGRAVFGQRRGQTAKRADPYNTPRALCRPVLSPAKVRLEGRRG